MRITSTAGLLAAVLFFGAGCSEHRIASGIPTSPRGLNAVVPVQLHGVLHVPAPQTSGIQGRLTSWLTADDGSNYDLVLDPGFEALSDPVSSGRGVTIDGDITLQLPAPVGAEPYTLRVTAFSFD